MPKIVSCTRKISGDSVRRTKGEIGDILEATEQYEIVLDSYATGVWVETNAPIPQQGDPHPDNQLLIATGEPTIENVDGSPIRYMATVVFRAPSVSPGGSSGDKSGQGTPKRDREPWVYTWSAVQSQEPIDTDTFGKPICTILGEQFDPPIVEDVYDAMFHEEFCVNDFIEAQYIERIGKTNSQAWKGFQPFQCRFTNFSATRYLDESGNVYFRVMHEVIIRKVPQNANAGEVWDRRIRAEGYIAKENADAPAKHYEINGEKTPVPVLHDKKTGVVINDPDDAQWYLFVTTNSFDFADLNIG